MIDFLIRLGLIGLGLYVFAAGVSIIIFILLAIFGGFFVMFFDNVPPIEKPKPPKEKPKPDFFTPTAENSPVLRWFDWQISRLKEKYTR